MKIKVLAAVTIYFVIIIMCVFYGHMVKTSALADNASLSSATEYAVVATIAAMATMIVLGSLAFVAYPIIARFRSHRTRIGS